MSKIDLSTIIKDRWVVFGFAVALAVCVYSLIYFFLRFDGDLPNQTIGYRSTQGFETGRSSSLYFLPLASVLFLVANSVMAVMVHKIDGRMARIAMLSTTAVLLTIIAVTERILE